MIDWITTTIRCTGPKVELDRIRAAIHDDLIEFDRLDPSPSELEPMSCVLQTTRTQAEADERNAAAHAHAGQRRREFALPPPRPVTEFVTEETFARLEREYGATNLDDWRIIHRGTRSTAGLDAQVLLDQPGVLVLRFTTEASAPMELIDRLVERGVRICGLAVTELPHPQLEPIGDAAEIVASFTVQLTNVTDTLWAHALPREIAHEDATRERGQLDMEHDCA